MAKAARAYCKFSCCLYNAEEKRNHVGTKQFSKPSFFLLTEALVVFNTLKAGDRLAVNGFHLFSSGLFSSRAQHSQSK